MIRAVLDVNVLASAVVSPLGSPAIVFGAWRMQAYELVVSETVLDRLTETLDKPYFRSRHTAHQRLRIFRRLRRKAILVKPAPDVRGVADDLEDDLVLATAVAGQATHLVTGDRDLLAHNGYRGLTLLTPADFRPILEAPETVGQP